MDTCENMASETSKQSLPELQGLQDNGSKSNSVIEVCHMEVEQSNADESPLSDATNSIEKYSKLFRFLNAPNNLQGRMILGKYKLSKQIDYSRLKELIIFNKLLDDPITYKITPEEFLEIRDEIIELFPTEDKNLFYVPRYRNEDGEIIGARGCLYNGYLFIRKELRRAGILTYDLDLETSVDNEEILVEEVTSTMNRLTDLSQDEYSNVEIIKDWEESYSKRLKLLNQKQVTLQTYLFSFHCLRPPLGVTLLESDFAQLNRSVLGNKVFDATIFSKTWPTIAPKVIEMCKKSRMKEVKDFLKIHELLIEEKKCFNTLALLLLPLCMTVTKTIKCSSSESDKLTITKTEISNTFILHIENSNEVDTKIEELENWLKEKEQPIHPFVIFTGPIENITQVSVVLKSQIYNFTDVTKAVEACHKCLAALHLTPFLCDYVWQFLNKIVFDKESKKNHSTVLKFVTDLKKLRESTAKEATASKKTKRSKTS